MTEPPDTSERPEARDDRKLRRGLAFAAGSFAVNAVLVTVSAIITSRLFGLEVIGQYALAMAPWQLLIVLSTVSEQVALLRALATTSTKTEQGTGIFAAVLSFSLALTTAMAIPILIVTVFFLRGPVGQPELIAPAIVLVLGYVLLENPSWNLDTVLSSHLAGRELLVARLLPLITFVTLAVLLRSVSGSVWMLVLSQTVAFSSGLAIRIAFTRGLFAGFPSAAGYSAGLRRLPQLLRFGLALLPGQLMKGLTIQAPIWIVASGVPVRLVGAYSRAATMAVRISEAGYRINEMLFPSLVRRQESGDGVGFVTTLLRTWRWAAIALLGLAAVAGGAAEPIMGLFGEGFSEGAGALQFLTLAYALFVLANIAEAGINALGRPGVNSLFSTLRLVVGLGSAALLLQPFGITGVAVGLTVGYLLDVLARLTWLRHATGRLGDHAYPWREIVLLGAWYGVSLTAGHYVAGAMPALAPALLLSLLTSALVFGVGVIASVLDRSERTRGWILLRRLRSRRLGRTTGTDAPSGGRPDPAPSGSTRRAPSATPVDPEES